MQLPNKLYAYRDSTLWVIPDTLQQLENGPMFPADLFMVLRPKLHDVSDFLSLMDCLYALRAIDMNEEGEICLCL